MNHLENPECATIEFTQGRRLLGEVILRRLRSDQPGRPIEDYEGLVDVDLFTSRVPGSSHGIPLAHFDATEALTLPAKEKDFLAAKITADRAVAATVFKGAQQLSFFELIQQTTGIVAEKISDKKINYFKQQLESLLQEEFNDTTTGYTKASAEKYLKTRELTNEEEVKQAAEEAIAELVDIALPYIDNIPEIEIIYYEDEQRQETAAAYTDENGKIIVSINTHTSRSHTKAKIASLIAHELYGHVAQFELMKMAMENGELTTLAGITSMMSPETTHFEVIAAIAEYFPIIASRKSGDKSAERAALVQFYRDKLASAILHNAWFTTNTEPEKNIEDIVQAVVADLHFDVASRTEEMIRNNRDILICRIANTPYAYSDAIAERVMTLPEDIRTIVIRKLYREAFLPHHIEELVTSAELAAAIPEVA